MILPEGGVGGQPRREGGFMTDSELRALCHRFLDAIERADFDTVEALYAPDFKLWFNATGAEISRDENLKVLREGAALHRRRTYDDRTINTFATGFVVQYSVNVVAHDGRRTSLWACGVALCRDGQITRLDEYLDSGEFGSRGRARGEQTRRRRVSRTSLRCRPATKCSGGEPTTIASSTRSTAASTSSTRYTACSTAGKGALWICIVGLWRDGKITRVDEYLDSGKFPAWRGARSEQTDVPEEGKR